MLKSMSLLFIYKVYTLDNIYINILYTHKQKISCGCHLYLFLFCKSKHSVKCYLLFFNFLFASFSSFIPFLCGTSGSFPYTFYCAPLFSELFFFFLICQKIFLLSTNSFHVMKVIAENDEIF